MDEHSPIIKWLLDNAAYAWFVMLAMWGGTANYISRQLRQNLPFSVVELIGEWSISGFSGLLTAYLCTHLELTFAMTAVATGIAGHMGGRSIFIIEQIVLRKAGVSSRNAR